MFINSESFKIHVVNYSQLVAARFSYLFRTVTLLLALYTLPIQKITFDEIKHFRNRCCTINLSQVVSGWLQAPRSTKSFVFTICSISQSNNLYLLILIRWSTLEQTLNLKYAWIFPCQVILKKVSFELVLSYRIYNHIFRKYLKPFLCCIICER